MAEYREWVRTDYQLPPVGQLVETKIDDQRGIRNEQQLRYDNRLWFFPDYTMYVYYTPTHWRLVHAEQKGT